MTDRPDPTRATSRSTSESPGEPVFDLSTLGAESQRLIGRIRACLAHDDPSTEGPEFEGAPLEPLALKAERIQTPMPPPEEWTCASPAALTRSYQMPSDEDAAFWSRFCATLFGTIGYQPSLLTQGSRLGVTIASDHDRPVELGVLVAQLCDLLLEPVSTTGPAPDLAGESA